MELPQKKKIFDFTSVGVLFSVGNLFYSIKKAPRGASFKAAKYTQFSLGCQFISPPRQPPVQPSAT